MAEPKNFKDYVERFYSNQKYSGFGLDTTIHMPCPFCAAEDFIVSTIIKIEIKMRLNNVCKECSRGMRIIFKRTGCTVNFECFQSSGPDQSEWLTPKMPRIES